MNRSHELGEEKVGKLLLKFSIPAIIGMLVNGLYNIVDRIFVGRGVGSLALSGIAISFPITLAIMAFGMLIGIGATSVISIRLGQQRREEAEQIVGNAFVLLVGITLVISLLGYLFMEPLLVSFGASADVLPYAKDYIRIILIGAVFQSIGFGMNNFIRAEGNPKAAMYTMILGAILNTILNPIFIFGLHLGVAGSALATVISQFVTSVWVLYYFLGDKAMLKLRLKNLKLKWIFIRDILAIGISPFSMQLVGSLVTVFLNRSLANYGGDIPIAAMGIITSVAMLIFMIMFGIGQGAQPILGYNYGARNYDRVKQTLKLSVVAATGVMTLGFLMVELFPVALMSLFSKDPELIRVGANGMRLYLLMLPIIGFQVTVVGYFQATGKPRKSLFLSLSRQLIFLVPALWILPKFLGLTGVWLAAPVSDLASAALTAVWLYKDFEQLGQSQGEI
ncbi:MATE family efflux transporter [Desulfosporosinus fructosivorans]|uniref:Multidrug export protein MepA n=1 Tax=Desulfosporosinus fructosivorans TaxID=2018669 RepID=A0A4Z0R6W2_9FIRM|nr:MATE family efflux transporter [Desulfosporosinus fructosivorans]TGE38284.1 MATE family efflux transporter [Desulfosporosinus fructosivorans]